MMHAILERARREGTPLIDGDTATFVWQGRHPPRLAGDFTDWEDGNAVTLTQVAQRVWIHQLVLPADAYIEYAYVQGQERLPDPFNPRTTPNGYGKVNQCFYMPAGAPTPLARRRRGVPHGMVTRHVIPTEDLAVGSWRTVHLYQPPSPEPCPLVVVWDGQDYLRRARLPQIVDNLLAQGRIRPIDLAMVENGGRVRSVEYACCEATVGLLLSQVLPLAQGHLRLLDPRDHPGTYGLLGASLGGLMALYTALRVPETFRHVLSQSGAFCLGQHDTVVSDLVRLAGATPLRVWLDVGRYESLRGANRRLHALLVERGLAAGYHEYNGGHNFPAWRDDVWRGLEALYGAGR